MGDTQLLLYRITVEPRVHSASQGSKGGLLGAITSIAHILDQSTEFVYKVKVTGEPVLLAVAMVANGSRMEQYFSQIAQLPDARVEVTCSPLVEFHIWAAMMGVPAELAKPSTYNITARHFYWFDINVEYTGKSQDELTDILRREGTISLQFREEKNVQLDLLKVLWERRFHLLVAMEAEDLQKIQLTLPLFRENGHNVHVTSKSVQQLTDYVRHEGVL